MKIPAVLIAALCCSCARNSVPDEPQTPIERQMLGLLQKFDLWDTNGDGELDQAEIAAGLKGRDTPYTAEGVIDFYDTSGNGKISLREAQAGFKRTQEVKIYNPNAPAS